MCSSKPKVLAPPPTQEPAPNLAPARNAGGKEQASAKNSKQRAAAALDQTTGTTMLGAAGAANVQKKTLLGQ